MKFGIGNTRQALSALALLTATLTTATPRARGATTGFVTPPFRGMPGATYGYWENFTVPVGPPGNAADQPGSTTSAILTQTNSGAFLAGANIYSTGISSFVLSDPASAPLTTVALQIRTLGSELDYSAVSLIYTNDSGAHLLAPLFRYELARIAGMGYGVSSLWQWDLSGLGVSNYTIAFPAAGPSVSLDSIVLDTATAVLGTNFLSYAAFPQQPFSLQAQRAAISRWDYLASDFSSSSRATASLFGALGDGPDFDSRDAQYLLGWNTTHRIPAGQGARNYLIRRARVTLTIASGGQYSYTGAPRDYRSYFPTNDPRYIAPASANYPVELFGAGFRGGFTNEQSVYVPWGSTNYPQTGPWSSGPSGVYSSVRVAYAAGFDTNGVLVDVSNNVSDNGTTELGDPFEVAPFAVGQSTNVAEGELMPTGSQITFDLNLDDPLIYSYVQRGLNQGNLSFIATCFVLASQAPAPPTFPAFYTIFSQIASPDQFPLLDIEGAVIRTNVDSDADGLADDWENFHFGSLLNAGATDTDGDGQNNLSEFKAASVPTAATNAFKILSLNHKPNYSELQFGFAPSRNYSIAWSTNLINWTTNASPSLNYSSAWLSKSVPNPTYPSPVFATWKDLSATNSSRFYRISAQ